MTRLVIANSELTLATKAVGPESFERWGSAGHAVVSEEKPETKDWLGENVEDGVANNFGIETNKSATIGNTPDDWVDGPKDQSETSNSTIERLGLAVLVGNSLASVESQLVDNGEISNAGNYVIAPFLTIIVTEGSKETSKDHDNISNDGDQDVGTTETGQKSKIEEQEWSGNTPVDISCPVNSSVDDLGNGVWNITIMGLVNDDLVVADTVTSGHGKVGNEGKGRDESGQNVEKTLLDWHTKCHGVECQRREGHNDSDNP